MVKENLWNCTGIYTQTGVGLIDGYFFYVSWKDEIQVLKKYQFWDAREDDNHTLEGYFKN